MSCAYCKDISVCVICGKGYAEAVRAEEKNERAETEAYAEGRKDQAEEDMELLRWAYSKLHHFSFLKLEDALMLDRFKLLLEHGVSA